MNNRVLFIILFGLFIILNVVPTYLWLWGMSLIDLERPEFSNSNENAVAEIVNGILKDEFYLDQCFVNTSNAKAATKNAIDIYNYKRLHLSLGYKTPNIVFNNAA